MVNTINFGAACYEVIEVCRDDQPDPASTTCTISSNSPRRPCLTSSLPKAIGMDSTSIPYYIIIDDRDENVTVSGANKTQGPNAYQEYDGTDTTINGEDTDVKLSFWGRLQILANPSLANGRKARVFPNIRRWEQASRIHSALLSMVDRKR